MMKNLRITEANQTDLRVGSMVASLMFISHSLKNINLKGNQDGNATFSSIVCDPTSNVLDVKISTVISWPDGREGHGVAVMSREDAPEETWKYACWKDEDSEVQVSPWQDLPECFRYQAEHGLPWPRNKRRWKALGISCLLSIMSGLVGVFLGGAVLFAIGALGSIVAVAVGYSADTINDSKLELILVLGIAAGCVGLSTSILVFQFFLRQNKAAEWFRYEKGRAMARSSAADTK